ncbi:MAG: B12-binding domain-containing radical SAM protein [Planctomycetota bacterium]|jgi:radical SAM superfamily enzyme YgiQ (UPF0313 family)
MYRHVLSVYPYRTDVKKKLYFPPLGLEIVSAALESYAHNIDVIDLRHDPAQTVNYLQHDTDLVCFSVNWGRDIDFVLEQIRSVPPDIFTIVGGREVTLDPERWLRDCPNIDILVRGDGEDVVQEIAQGISPDRIKGVSYHHNGNIVHNPPREDMSHNGNFYPNRRRRRYRYEWDMAGVKIGWTIDAVAGSRGCPFSCKFCSFNRNPWRGKRPWITRPVESIIRELEEIEAEIIVFTDDIFTHDMDRVAALCDQILERGIRKRFIANARIEVAKRMDVVKKMERAGFVSLLLGIESAHDKTLRSMNKGFDTKKITEYLQLLRRSKIILHGYFIIGNIGESEKEILEIAPFARRIGVDTLSLSPIRTVPYDGMADLIARNPGYHVSPDGFIFSDAISKKRIRELRRRIWQDFYSIGHLIRLSWKLLRSGLIKPTKFGARSFFGFLGVALGHRHRMTRRRKSRLVQAKSD